jgi:tetratricopeptide (TPR) repeat protein
MGRSLGLVLWFMVVELAISMYPANIVLAEETTAKKSTYRKMREQELDKLLRLIDYRGRLTLVEHEKINRQILAIYKGLGDLKGEVKTLVSLAYLDARRYRHSRAINTLRQALKLARASGDIKFEFEIMSHRMSLENIVKNRLIPGDMPVYEYLIKRDSNSDDIEARVEYLFEHKNFCAEDYFCTTSGYGSIGDAYVYKKLYPRAIEFYKKGILKLRKISSEREPRTSILLLKMGLAHKLMGNEAEALIYLNEALVYYEKTLDLIINGLKQGKKMGYLGVFEDLKEFTVIAAAKGSNQLLEKVLYTQKLLRDSLIDEKTGTVSLHLDVDMGSAYEDTGDAYSEVGNYKVAMMYYQKAIDYYSQVKPPKDENDKHSFLRNVFLIKHKIARTYVRLGDEANALIAYEDLLKFGEIRANLVKKEERDSYRPSFFFYPGFLIDIGNFYASRGDRQKAMNFYKQADYVSGTEWLGGGYGGGSGSVSIISDEDDLDKLLPSPSTESKSDSTTQEQKK